VKGKIFFTGLVQLVATRTRLGIMRDFLSIIKEVLAETTVYQRYFFNVWCNELHLHDIAQRAHMMEWR